MRYNNNDSKPQKMSLTDNMYMLSGCKLIDAENISLQSQNMKFVGE